MPVSIDNAVAQSVLVRSGHTGEQFSLPPGCVSPGSTANVVVSSVTRVNVGSDLSYERSLGPLTIPDCNIDITISSVDTVTFGATPYLFGIKTVEITKSVPITNNAGRFLYGAPGGTYDIRIFGKAAPGTSTVSVQTTVSQNVKVDSSGSYSINSAGLPSGVYSVSVNGKLIERIYLDDNAEKPLSYTLNLNQGWNLISIPINPENNQIDYIFSASQMANIDVIWDFNGGDWKYWTTEPGYTNQFSTLSPAKGYYVYCYGPMTVTIYGSASIGPIPLSSLSQGWNFIGFPSLSEASISTLYGVADVVWKCDNDNWFYWTTEPGYTNQFETLTPGFAYWIYII